MADSALEPKPPKPRRVTQLSSERCLQKHLRKIRWLNTCAILVYLSYILSTADDEPSIPSSHPYNTTPPPLMHLILLFAIASLFDMLLGLVDNKRYPIYVKIPPLLFIAAIAFPVFFWLTRHDSWAVLNWLPTLAESTGFLRAGCVKALATCRRQLEKREGEAVEK